MNEQARFYILTVISRLDSAICLLLFRFFVTLGTDGANAVFNDYLSEKIPDKETEFLDAIRKAKGGRENIDYPFDIFGTQIFLNFLYAWRGREAFTKYLSDKMIVYTNQKSQNLIQLLIGIFLLRQELEHPGKNYNSIKLGGSKYKFDMNESLKSLFLFLPEHFINHIAMLMPDKRDLMKNVCKTNAAFRTSYNKNNPGMSGKFHRLKMDAFIGVANLETTKNIIPAEIKNFSDKNKKFFSGNIPYGELIRMFDFILGVQTVFRRHFGQHVLSGNPLRDMVAHSHLFFDKLSQPYLKVFGEKITTVLNWIDSEYAGAKPSKAQLKTDFIRGLKALCNRKDYWHICMRIPVRKDSGEKVWNNQTVEIKPEQSAERYGAFSRNIMECAIESRIKEKQNNLNLADARFDKKKRIFLNLIRQKAKQIVIDTKKQNKSACKIKLPSV